MMYIPGIIHESLQKLSYYELVNLDSDDIIALDNIRSNETHLYEDASCYYNHIIIERGDIISIRYFRSNQISEVHVFLEDIFRKDGTVINVNSETLSSKRNFNFRIDQKFYKNVDTIMIRNKNISYLLDNLL